MANKISQITIGDALYIQLDANPVTDGIGYNAPLGSLAFTSGGAVFAKIPGPATQWHTLTNTFLNGGNNFGSAVNLTLGSIGDKDLRFIRNNIEGMAFYNQNTLDNTYAQIGIKFLNNKLRLTNHNVKNDEMLSNSIVFSNEHLALTTLQSDRTSMMRVSQGAIADVTRLGSIIGFAPIKNPTTADEDVFLAESKQGYGILNKAISGASTPIDLPVMLSTDAKMLFAEILVMVRNIADNKISHRKKLISIKCIDYANRQYAQVFDADAFAYYETDEFDFNLTFSHTTDNARPEKTLNTYLPTVNVTNLTIGQSFDIAVIATGLSFQDENS